MASIYGGTGSFDFSDAMTDADIGGYSGADVYGDYYQGSDDSDADRAANYARQQESIAALRADVAARQEREQAQARAAQAAMASATRPYTPAELNPTRTQTQIELDAQRLREKATNISPEQQMKERLIGSGIGAIVPIGGMMYGLANMANRAQQRSIADQLLQQDEYKGGLFGTGFLAGTPAASYVPVYDENDNLVGSIGVDAEGQAMRYTGPRIEDYSGFGADLVTRDPFENMNQGGDNDDTAAALTQPQPAAPAQAPASQIPLVPLPSAFVGQRPMVAPMTQATQVQPMQPFRPGAPAPQGIMATQQALRPSYINIGKQNPLQQ